MIIVSLLSSPSYPNRIYPLSVLFLQFKHHPYAPEVYQRSICFRKIQIHTRVREFPETNWNLVGAHGAVAKFGGIWVTRSNIAYLVLIFVNNTWLFGDNRRYFLWLSFVPNKKGKFLSWKSFSWKAFCVNWRNGVPMVVDSR